MLENRELRVAHEEVTRSSALEATRLMESEQELLAAMELNQSLQESVSRLRGADVEDLEREMANEVEAIRHQAQQREEELRLQLEDARDMLRGDGSRLGDLADENAQLRERVAQMEELLREIKDHSGLGLSLPTRSHAADHAVQTPDWGGEGSGTPGKIDANEGELQKNRDISLDMILGDNSSEQSDSDGADHSSAGSLPLPSTPTVCHISTPSVPPLSPADAIARAVLLKDLMGIVLYSSTEAMVLGTARPSSRRCIQRGIVRFILGLKAPRISSPTSHDFDALNDYDDFSLTAQEQACANKFIQAVESLIAEAPEAMIMCARDEPSEQSWVLLRNRLVSTYLQEEEQSSLATGNDDSFEPRRLEAFLTGQSAPVRVLPSAWKAESEKLNKEIELLRTAINKKDRQILILEEEIATVRDDLERSMSEATNMSMSIVSEDREQWIAQMKTLDDRSRELEHTSVQVLQKLRAAEKEKTVLERELKVAAEEHADQLAAITNERDHLMERLRTFQSAIESSADRMQSLEDERSGLQRELSLLRAQCDEESRSSSELREQLAEAESLYRSERNELESKVISLEAQLARNSQDNKLDDVLSALNTASAAMERRYNESILPLADSCSSAARSLMDMRAAPPAHVDGDDVIECICSLEAWGSILVADVARLCRSLDSCNAEKSEQSAQIDKLSDEMGRYQVHVENLERERDTLSSTIRRMALVADPSGNDYGQNEERIEKFGLMTSVVMENFELTIMEISEKIHDVEREMNIIESRCDDLRQEHDAMNVESEREKLSLEIVHLNTERESYHQQMHRLNEEREEVRNTLKSLRMEFYRDVSASSNIGGDPCSRHVKSEEEDQGTAPQEHQKGGGEISGHTDADQSQVLFINRLATTQSLLDAKTRDLDVLRREHEALLKTSSSHDDLRSTFAQMGEEKAEMERQLKVAAEEHADQLAAITNERDHLMERLRTFQSAIESSADRMQSLEDERSGLQRELSLLRAQCDEESRSSSELREQLAEAESLYRSERNELESKVISLEAQLARNAIDTKSFPSGLTEVLLLVRQVNVLLVEAGISEGTDIDENDLGEEDAVRAMQALQVRVELLLEKNRLLHGAIEDAEALVKTYEGRCSCLKEQLEDAMSKHDELEECIRDIDEDRDAILSKIEQDKRVAEKLAKGQIDALQGELTVVTQTYLTAKCRIVELSDELENSIRLRDAQIKTLQAERDTLAENLTNLTRESAERLEALDHERSQLDEQIATLLEKNGTLQTQYELVESKLAAANKVVCDESPDLKRQLEVYEATVRELEHRECELNDEKFVLVDELKNVNRHKIAAERERDELAKKLKAMEGRNVELQDEIRQVEEERDVIVDELRRKHADTAAVSALQREKNVMAEELHSQCVATEEYKEQIQALEGEIGNLRAALVVQREEIEQLKVGDVSGKRILEEQIVTLEGRIAESSAQIKTLEEDRMALTRQLRGTWARQVGSSDDLGEHVENLKREYEALCHRLEAVTAAKCEAEEMNAALQLQVQSKDTRLIDLAARLESALANASTRAAGAADISQMSAALEQMRTENTQLMNELSARASTVDTGDWENERRNMLQREESLLHDISQLREELEVVAGMFSASDVCPRK